MNIYKAVIDRTVGRNTQINNYSENLVFPFGN